MTSNVVQLRAGPRWRVLVAHQRSEVRHVLRTLIEAESVAVVDAGDGDAAFAELESRSFDLLVLELDLPLRDGLSLMQLHRVLLAHERNPVEPPAVIFMLAAEVRRNAALTDHLRSLGVAGFIDDTPRADVAPLVEAILAARAERLATGKPAAA
jgi:CheY-like chemotaxis protein